MAKAKPNTGIQKITPTAASKSQASTASAATKPQVPPTNSNLSKNTRSETYEIVETLVVVPPDGGWGWVVVMTSFICNFAADGTMYTFGMFLDEMSETIGCKPTEVAMANSLMTGFYYLCAPLTGALTNRYGFRIVSILGSLIAGASILATSYFSTLYIILLVYGVGGGVGFGMMYMPSIISIGFYFEKWRALATSIAVCGSSLGIISFPIIFQQVLKDEQWQFKFRLLAIGCFTCACFSLLYRPLRPVKVIAVDEKRVQFNTDRGSLMSLYTNDERELGISRYHNLGYPTSADVHGNTQLGRAHKTSSSSGFVGISGPSTGSYRSIRSERLKTINEYEQVEEPKCRCKCSCDTCFWCCCLCCAKHQHYTTPSRPMYRDDIFYGGSVMRLMQYRGSVSYSTSPLNYPMSVTRITTQNEILQVKHNRCVCCPESITRTLVTMLDISVLKSPSMLLLSLSGFITLLGAYTPFMFIFERAKANGMDPETAYYLISALGIANTIGRILSGILSSLPNLNALFCSCVFLTICGAATLGSSFSFSVLWQFGFASIYGATIACVAALRPIILVDMVGLDKLTNAFGINLCFQGVACLTGVPLTGLLRDLTGDYKWSFYFTGGVILTSAFMLMPIKMLMRWEKKRGSDVT